MKKINEVKLGNKIPKQTREEVIIFLEIMLK